MGEYKDIYKDKKKVQGIFISHMEMLHVTLKYPKMVTKLNLEKVLTMKLEVWVGIQTESDDPQQAVHCDFMLLQWKFYNVI